MPILDHTSYSQINMWQRCPRQWYYRCVKGLKVPPSGALIEGSCYHTALEANFKQKIVTMEDLPVEQCLDAFSDAWEARLQQEEIEWEDKKPGQLKDEGIKLVGAYIDTTAPQVQPIEVEKPYVREVAGVKVVSVIDLIDEDSRIIDHKTSSKAYSQDSVDKDDQLTTYAYMRNRAALCQIHVAVKPGVRTPARIQVLKTYRTGAHMEWWHQMVTEILKQMKTGVAPPRPTGWWCSPRFCGFYSRCRGMLP